MSTNSQNLRGEIRVFVDTEYTDFKNMNLISIALAADNGKTFYAENLEFNDTLSSTWVKKNVYPLLNNKEHGLYRSEIVAKMREWLDGLNSNVQLIFDYYKDKLIVQNLFCELPACITSQDNLFDILVIEYRKFRDVNDQEAEEIVKNDYGINLINYYSFSGKRRNHALSDVIIIRSAFLKTLEKIRKAQI